MLLNAGRGCGPHKLLIIRDFHSGCHAAVLLSNFGAACFFRRFGRLAASLQQTAPQP